MAHHHTRPHVTDLSWFIRPCTTYFLPSLQYLTTSPLSLPQSRYIYYLLVSPMQKAILYLKFFMSFTRNILPQDLGKALLFPISEVFTYSPLPLLITLPSLFLCSCITWITLCNFYLTVFWPTVFHIFHEEGLCLPCSYRIPRTQGIEDIQEAYLKSKRINVLLLGLLSKKRELPFIIC